MNNMYLLKAARAMVCMASIKTFVFYHFDAKILRHLSATIRAQFF